MSTIKRQVALGMLLGAPGEPADLGPGGVPEGEHDAFELHVGHPDQVPLPAVADIEGILDLLSFARGLVQHEFLGVVSSVALLCHENLPFRGLLEMGSINSLPNAEQLFSCPIFLFMSRREGVFSETEEPEQLYQKRYSVLKNLCVPFSNLRFRG